MTKVILECQEDILNIRIEFNSLLIAKWFL